MPAFPTSPPPPLTLILYSEREKRGEVVATVLDSSYQPLEGIYRLRAGGPRLNFVSHATDEAKTDIGGGSETDLLHRGEEGAACQDENINDRRPERDTERDELHAKFIV